MDAFDKLISEAMALKGQAKKKRPARREAASEVVRRTKEELRAMQLEQCEPTAVVLRTTEQTCRCGATYTSVNNVPLLFRVGKKLSHYEPCLNPDDYLHLPFIQEVHDVALDWCPTCMPKPLEIKNVKP